MAKLTKDEMKQIAVDCLKKLEILPAYVRGFASNKNRVCFFEGLGAGYWADQEPEVMAKLKEVEEKYGVTVYAITHEYTEFGECWDFLYVSDESDETEYNLEDCGSFFRAMAYVWNKTDDFSSEIGSIGVRPMFGGIKRCY